MKPLKLAVLGQHGAALGRFNWGIGYQHAHPALLESDQWMNKFTGSNHSYLRFSQSAKESLGRIQDTDYAVETTNLPKAQILQQSATSMLAQANMSKDVILSLVQG